MKKYQGQVIEEQYAVGSKSEYMAVMIELADGQKFLLRRPGGNPFKDNIIHSLVGDEISCNGEIRGNVLFITNWVIE